MSTPGWNWQRIKQMLSNTLRLSFFYLKNIHILHPRYPKNNRTPSKKQAKEQVCLYSWDYTLNHNENEDENEK